MHTVLVIEGTEEEYMWKLLGSEFTEERVRPEERRRNELYRQYYEELQRRIDAERPVDCSVIVVNKLQKWVLWLCSWRLIKTSVVFLENQLHFLFCVFVQGICRDGGQEGSGSGYGGGSHLPEYRSVIDPSSGGCESGSYAFCHHHHPAAPSTPFLYSQHPLWDSTRCVSFHKELII